jgi:hypothetical protein
VYTVRGRGGENVSFRGSLLGEASSHQREHQHLGDTAPPGWRCRACRWFEVAIYRVVDDVVSERATYLVHTLGRTRVPDEIDFARVAWADTAFKVMELLTQWRQRRPVLPDASVEAIELAAARDHGLSVAYDRWLEAGVG